MVYHHTSTPSTDNSFQGATPEEEEEEFPTAPLDDGVWLEEPVLVRHLCIHKQSQPHCCKGADCVLHQCKGMGW